MAAKTDIEDATLEDLEKASEASDDRLSRVTMLADDPLFVEYEGLTSTRNSVTDWVRAVVASCLMGLVFGALFVRTRVFEPNSIRGQFVFERWLMLKMFLGAAGTSAFLFAIFSKVSPDRFEQERQIWDASRIYRGAYSAAIGGSMLGIGMAISGTCPGMVLAQLGAGVSNSWLTFLGGLSGAFVYGVMEPWISKQAGKFSPSKLDSRGAFIDFIVGARFHYVALSLAIGCALVVLVLELVFPWEEELLVPNEPDCSFFLCRAFPPSLGGVILGMLQIPAFYLVRSFLGSSTCYQTLCSVWLNLSTAFAKQFEYMAQFARPSVAAYWQVFYAASAVVGAYLLERSNNSFGTVPGVDAVSAFVGGFLCIFGSRFGAGCTSGHGISGMSLLLSHGVIAVCFMFAGGIVTGFIWREVFDENYARLE